jgi:hypothetical protein
VAWYRNPDWKRSVLCEDFSRRDNVCIAALDIDGDGKAEVAVGAEWNPSDTANSGSAHYLIPPADRREKWEVVDLHREPTVHRMLWAAAGKGKHHLVVAPLHGRDNRNGEGIGVKVLAYRMPADPRAPWETELIDYSLHVVHNLELVNWDDDPEEEILLAAREGVFHLNRVADGWQRLQIAGNREGEEAFRGASEVRAGKLPGGKRLIATVEPFHGNEVVVYTPPPAGARAVKGKLLWARRVIEDGFNQGHALACADLLGVGSDQVVAGWRNKDREGKVGINLYTPLDGEGKDWKKAPIDSGGMACEDLKVGDLDGDGRLDVVAAGRDSHNLKIYWNRGAAKTP